LEPRQSFTFALGYNYTKTKFKRVDLAGDSKTQKNPTTKSSS